MASPKGLLDHARATEPGWACVHGVWVAPLLDRSFERSYLAVREAEGRLYTDEIVLRLPDAPRNHPHAKEWKTRAVHHRAFAAHMAQVGPPRSVLEIGCGHGWFLASALRGTAHEGVGLDVNVVELEQAARVFKAEPLLWVASPLRGELFPPASFDDIILASAIQYFPVLSELLDTLAPWLRPGGELHIIDSPLYDDDDARAAALQRSAAYYRELGHPEMIPRYHAHTWADLHGRRVQVRSKPGPLSRLWGAHSPFAWVRLR